MDITEKFNALIARGFHFVHPRDEQGEVVAVVGIRIHDDVVDLVRVHAEDDAIATRAPADEQDVLQPESVLWQYSGSTAEVIDSVLELPDRMVERLPNRHDKPDWPRTAGRSAAGCWVGDGRGRAKFLSASA